MEKRKYKKRTFWCANSEHYLVELWAQKLPEFRTVRKNGHILLKIHAEMKRKGFNFDLVDLKGKMHNLKNKYKQEKAKAETMNEPPSDWPLYDALDEMFGGSNSPKTETLTTNSNSNTNMNTDEIKIEPEEITPDYTYSAQNEYETNGADGLQNCFLKHNLTPSAQAEILSLVQASANELPGTSQSVNNSQKPNDTTKQIKNADGGLATEVEDVVSRQTRSPTKPNANLRAPFKEKIQQKTSWDKLADVKVKWTETKFRKEIEFMEAEHNQRLKNIREEDERKYAEHLMRMKLMEVDLEKKKADLQNSKIEAKILQSRLNP